MYYISGRWLGGLFMFGRPMDLVEAVLHANTKGGKYNAAEKVFGDPSTGDWVVIVPCEEFQPCACSGTEHHRTKWCVVEEGTIQKGKENG